MQKAQALLLEPDEIGRALGVLVAPGAAFEIRILDAHRPGRNWRPKTTYGYFDDPARVAPALAALRLDAAKGFYVTLNPIDPTLLARSYNRFAEAKTNSTTSDKHILSRRWLLVDFDSVRPADISSSDEEKEAAHVKCREAYEVLRSAGWPSPVVADSGNGYHLLYRLDLPTDDDRVKGCLEALDLRFSSPAVDIDTTVFNPSRIVKLYGTRAMKGDDCAELGRPHRMSRLLHVPDHLGTVPAELIDALAGQSVPDEEE